MTLREKLARLKAERGLTTEALSARSGVPRGTLNKILNGETRNPTIATLAALADALDCPLESLSTRAVDVPQPARAPSDIPGVYRLRDLAREAPQGQARDAGGAALPALPQRVPLRRRRIPLLGEIAAGQPLYVDEDFDVADCDTAFHCDFALRVHGDSMVGARIRDGDIVFIRAQEDVDDGQIAAVIVDGEATLKRVYHIKNGLQLLSENPSYPPMVFTLSEYGCIRILGRAVGFQSAL